MRCLKRNEQTFYYALYLRTEKVFDANGYQTGSHAVYRNPVKARANVSASQGTNVYTTPQLDANGAVVLNADGSMVTPPDYIVSSIQRGLPIFGNAVVTVVKADVR